MIKILHVFGSMNRGGAELRTLDVINKIHKEDLTKFDFLALSGSEGSLDKQIKNFGASIHYLYYRNPLFLFRLLILLNKEKYDIIHSHVHYFSGFILFVARLAKIRTRITHFRNSYDGNKKTYRRLFINKILKWSINLNSTQILAVSNETMEKAWSINWQNDDRCRVIYNGIEAKKLLLNDMNKNDLKSKLGFNEDDILIINLARFTNSKNQLRTIEIFNEIVRIIPSAKLLLVGNKSERKLVEKCKIKIENLGISNSIFILGEKEEIALVLNAVELMLFPSLWEGLPGAVLESAAVGLPVLASNLSGIKEIEKYCPAVKTLSLKESNKQWAREAKRIISNYDITCSITAIDKFAQSPFTLDVSINHFRDVWRIN